MRVAAVVPLYPPRSRVGAWLSTHECLRAVAARGHRVDVVAYLERPYRYDLHGVTVHGGRGAIQRTLDAADVVVSHAGDDGKAHRAAVRSGRPSVVMLHGLPERRTVERFRQAPPTVTVANAQATAAIVQWDGPVAVVRPPVHPADHATIPGDRVTLVNCTRAKGVAVLAELAERMPTRPFLAVLGGYGVQEPPALPNVEIVGPVADMRRNVWSRTRVLLMPSKVETWGRVAVEAAASGIPTIAAPCPGIVEALGDAGTYVARGDVDAWQAALEALDAADRYRLASVRARARSAELEPTADLERFVGIIEGVAAWH